MVLQIVILETKLEYRDIRLKSTQVSFLFLGNFISVVLCSFFLTRDLGIIHAQDRLICIVCLVYFRKLFKL